MVFREFTPYNIQKTKGMTEITPKGSGALTSTGLFRK